MIFTLGRSEMEARSILHYQQGAEGFEGWKKARRRSKMVGLMSALLFPLYWGNKWYYGEPNYLWYIYKIPIK